MEKSVAMKGLLAAFFVALALALCAVVPQSAYASQGWNHDTKGFWYQYDKNKNHYYKNGWKQIGSDWLYFNSSGYAKEGWIKSGKKWYYLDGSSDMPVAKFTAMSKVNGGYSNLAKLSDGKVHSIPYMAYGYQYIGASMYYLDPSDGHMHTGWIDMTSGPAKGWHYAKDSGALAMGWQKINNKWYYFGDEEGTGYTSAKGFVEIGNAAYYFDDSFAMVTGWKQINGKWYHFAPSGAMTTNKWVGNYYLQADGTMVTNAWIGRFHVDENGKWDKTRAVTTTATTGTTTA